MQALLQLNNNKRRSLVDVPQPRRTFVAWTLNPANDEQADGRQQAPMKTPSISGPAQPFFQKLGRCLLSATISNAGEAGNAAVISHFQPLIRSNKEKMIQLKNMNHWYRR